VCIWGGSGGGGPHRLGLGEGNDEAKVGPTGTMGLSLDESKDACRLPQDGCLVGVGLVLVPAPVPAAAAAAAAAAWISLDEKEERAVDGE
jgi:hypothetical protein